MWAGIKKMQNNVEQFGVCIVRAVVQSVVVVRARQQNKGLSKGEKE